jgi:hypothetical protein
MLNTEKFVVELTSSLLRLTNELNDIKNQVEMNTAEINKLKEVSGEINTKIDNLKITEDVCFLGRLANFNKILLRVNNGVISLGELLWLLLDFLGLRVDFETREGKEFREPNYYVIPKLVKKKK